MASNGIVFDISSNSYHLGHYFLHWVKQNPDEIFQIDAATGEKETNESVLSRSIQLAKCFRNCGLKPGDVIALGGTNHLDIHIPYYAGLLNGLPIAGVDPFFQNVELKRLFKTIEPKIAFCQYEQYDDYKRAIDELRLDTKIVTFGKPMMIQSYSKFIDKFSGDFTEDFIPAVFDTDKIFAWLACTSGSTGLPKVTAFKHKKIIECFEHIRRRLNPNGTRKKSLHLSSTQWISSYINALHVVMNSCKVQTSAPSTVEHVIDIINEYRPTLTTISPNLLCAILSNNKQCDLQSFDIIISTGGKMQRDYIAIVKSKLRHGGMFCELYAQTETLGPTLKIAPLGPEGNCGTVIEAISGVKLVDVNTGNEITEPNVPGEMYCKPRFGFSEYYNDPVETQRAFVDGWFKTGDLLYRDGEGYFFYVDRLKALIKYRGYHVYPSEIEDLIRTLEGVQDVCVTSIPHIEDREHPVACVVKKPGSNITEEQIKDIVKYNMSVNNEIRGGVIFLKELPLTSTGKVARGHLKTIVMKMKKISA